MDFFLEFPEDERIPVAFSRRHLIVPLLTSILTRTDFEVGCLHEIGSRLAELSDRTIKWKYYIRAAYVLLNTLTKATADGPVTALVSEGDRTYLEVSAPEGLRLLQLTNGPSRELMIRNPIRPRTFSIHSEVFLVWFDEIRSFEVTLPSAPPLQLSDDDPV